MPEKPTFTDDRSPRRAQGTAKLPIRRLVCIVTMRPALSILLLFLLVAPASAQYRPAQVLPELTSGTLTSLLDGAEADIERCASRTDAGAYVATVRAHVSPGAAPSTLYGARIGVDVVSRPRDSAFEACVRRAVRDALRHAPYAVPRSVRAQRTFQIAERPTPPIARPAPPFEEREVHQALASRAWTLQQCLEIAGVPEQVTLRVAVRPDGRLVLTSADVPPGAARGAIGCLAARVSSVRVSGRPARTVDVVHRLAVRDHAW